MMLDRDLPAEKPAAVASRPAAVNPTLFLGRNPMPTRISGSFDVKMTPQPSDAAAGEPQVGRMTLDKQYHGELQAASKGQMLAFRSLVQGSAGYVAMERVVGTLAGRSGSFVLQHAGLMDKGAPTLTIHVVPDSGTDQLTGLSGTMTIRVENKAHFYDFDFTLPVG